MSVRVILGLLAILVIGSCGGVGGGLSGPPCSFEDPVLEAEVAAALGKDGGPVSEGEVATLDTLEVIGAGIASLEGIQCATSLETLRFSQNSISDLSPISELPIQILHAADNQLTDLSPLAGMGSLRTVDLAGNQLDSFAALSGLDINNLILSDNQITALDGLEGHSFLVYLHLSGNPIASLAPLEGLSDLGSLSLDRCGLSTIDDLPTLPELRTLNLAGNELTAIPATARFPMLAEVDLADNQIADASGSDDSLNTLILDRNPVTDFTGLGVYRLQINQMPGIPDLTTISSRNITARESGIVDLSGLGAPSYGLLDLGDNQIVDPSPLAALTFEPCASIILDGNPLDEVSTADTLAALCDQGAQVSIDGVVECNLEICDPNTEG